MDLDTLTAISPIDGRYRNKVKNLANYFSEYALIKYRVKVEIEYFISLSHSGIPQLNPISEAEKNEARSIYLEFSNDDAKRIKNIESVTNHDVKAVEYFLREKFEEMGWVNRKEWIHFGLTSQDINNTSIPLSVKDAHQEELLPMLEELIAAIDKKAEEWKDIPMLAKTHGQPASPTKLGKEMKVFVVRLQEQVKQLKNVPFAAKFGGATGNMNAHYVTFPNIEWHSFADEFVSESLGLKRSYPTTQIEHYDHAAAYFDAVQRINNILIDFNRDVWTYISMDYFKQKIKKGEVGSSAMPHKVNPIDFENSEGNLGVANALLHHLSAKLPISRLQRDLTDSTVWRNVGVPIAHTMIALQSTLKGLGKLLLNEAALQKDLENNWAVVAEAIQTILRRENYPHPYEALKGLTRTNEKINKTSIATFIDTLEVSDVVKEELKRITPQNYTGQA